MNLERQMAVWQFDGDVGNVTCRVKIEKIEDYKSGDKRSPEVRKTGSLNETKNIVLYNIILIGWLIVLEIL